MNGILIIDKPQGMTSHDVVDFIRRRFSLKKVGHAGTLDPMATGVLVILIGKATRSSGRLTGDDKEYEATVVFGKRSDTGDVWGKLTDSGPAVSSSAKALDEAFSGFLGEIEQIPPMYAALKMNGKKLYELARKGMTVERRPRKVVIKKLEILKVALPEVDFRVRCSKGTYIRQLCVDIGEKLGCGACLGALRRTMSGGFSLAGALRFDELKSLSAAGLEKRLLTNP